MVRDGPQRGARRPGQRRARGGDRTRRVAVLAGVLAVAAAGGGLAEAARAPLRPIAWDAARARGGGRLADFAVTDIPCRLPLRYARVRESRRAVTVTLYSPKPTGPCIQIVARACATVRLPHALAGRRLRDGAPPAGRRDPGARPFRGCRRIPVRS